MTPKRLGVWIVIIAAAWSLFGPGGTTFSDRDPGVAGVGIAQAGDPDQYANKPQGNPGGDTDSSKTVPPPEPPRTGDTGYQKPGTFSTLMSVVSLVLWGSTATLWH